MKWVRRAIGLVLIVAVAAGVIWSFLPQPTPVDIGFVSRGLLEVTVDEDGKTRIKEKYIVSTPVGGRLNRISLREGDRVGQDETVLAAIEPGDPALLDARALAQARARVSAAEAALDRARTRFKQTQVELDRAEKDFRRMSNLHDTGSVSASDFESAEANWRSRQQIARSAEFEQDIARYELQTAEAALVHVQPGDGDQPPDAASENFRIHSPIDGVVLRVLQESSTVVTPGTPIVEVGDPGDLEVVVDVLSRDAVRIRPGAHVYLEHWGGSSSISGVVRLVEPSAFEKVSALGVEEQRVNVIIDITESEELSAQLGDGYRVEARMVVWRGADVLRVPTSALFRQENDWAVFQVTGGRAVLTRVELGHRNEEYAEVIEGLEKDAAVILHPGDNLVDQALVESRE